jgi:integrase/recombinase XerD
VRPAGGRDKPGRCRSRSKHIVTNRKTPVAEADEARQLLDSIDATTLVGLRDRALIALLLYTFARVSAAIGMNVEDYYPQGRRFWVRLHEKGGKQHDMPAHHVLEQYLDEYVTAAGIGADKATPLFRTAAGTTGRLTERGMHRLDALRMIQRRTRCVHRHVPLLSLVQVDRNHRLPQRGGLLAHAQKMAAHASTKTTKHYDRRDDQATLCKVERIVLSPRRRYGRHRTVAENRINQWMTH